MHPLTTHTPFPNSTQGAVAIAAQWSAASGTWVEIGEVTGASNAGTINGKAYDHVFPIELEQPGGAGVQQLQIGYNNGDNPFQAAQTFIDEHMLPQRYLAQIADYITERARQVSVHTFAPEEGTKFNWSPPESCVRVSLSLSLIAD